jgi:hypothetical protein
VDSETSEVTEPKNTNKKASNKKGVTAIFTQK